MEQKPQGISSLSKRLERLERKQNNDTSSPPSSSDDDELSKMMIELQRREKQQKKQTMKSILEHYLNDLLKEHDDVSFNNLFNIVFFSVKYVEANHKSLANTLQVKTCSEFKRSICISFIKHLLPNIFIEMLELSIDSTVKMIYPKPSINLSQLTIEENQTQSQPIDIPKKKKGLFGK